MKPVGSSAEVPFHARVVAATNRRLEAEVKAGRFREESLLPPQRDYLELPPLRERAGDIPLLAEHFLERQRKELGRPGLRFSAEAWPCCPPMPSPATCASWRTSSSARLPSADGDVLTLGSLPPSLRESRLLPPTQPSGGEVALRPGFSLEHHLDDAERRYLLAALAQSSGVKTRAAELLGLTFRSFRYRLADAGSASGTTSPEPRRPARGASAEVPAVEEDDGQRHQHAGEGHGIRGGRQQLRAGDDGVVRRVRTVVEFDRSGSR